MALKLLINISKKVPGPQEYSSVQASVSLEGEISANQDPVAEATRLQGQAERAVDQFLGITQSSTVSPVPSTNPVLQPPATSQPAQSPATFVAPNASQPYRGNQRRGPALASAAQLRYLRQLLDKSGHTVNDVCNRFGIPNVEALRSRDASNLIDEIRGSLPAGTG